MTYLFHHMIILLFFSFFVFFFFFLFFIIFSFFFFLSSRRRHTRLTCYWSTDVCSSDLADTSRHPSAATPRPAGHRGRRYGAQRPRPPATLRYTARRSARSPKRPGQRRRKRGARRQIGRAWCRGRGEVMGAVGW